MFFLSLTTLRTFCRAVLFILGIAVLFCRGSIAEPLPNTSPQAPDSISLDYQNAPVQDVLKALFTQAQMAYQTDSDVAGQVSVTVQDVSFALALKSVLRASDTPLTYDQANGYHIRVAAPPVPVTAPEETAKEPSAPVSPASSNLRQAYRIPVNRYDAAYMADLLTPRSALVTVLPNLVTPSSSTGNNNGFGNNAGNNRRGRGNGGYGRGRRGGRG